ncbi:hypothetical protein K505DRAFT_118737 [Melanomma pulvis-pyrius CBS 109.77]|uniref:Uncharacterized protein n=1 Tax=Melanomma pulvis-pyrius CBS 109.77 TaxID=1314802 RepID=A0A6A6WVN1_9PLEO|nr:hypothetical protein K505DRAFT_118737 [Melanomma pulvis-pyrius CBS 109.77]
MDGIRAFPRYDKTAFTLRWTEGNAARRRRSCRPLDDEGFQIDATATAYVRGQLGESIWQQERGEKHTPMGVISIIPFSTFDTGIRHYAGSCSGADNGVTTRREKQRRVTYQYPHDQQMKEPQEPYSTFKPYQLSHPPCFSTSSPSISHEGIHPSFPTERYRLPKSLV